MIDERYKKHYERSVEKIKTLNPDVQKVAQDFLDKSYAAGNPIVITSGNRTHAEQQAIYDQGRTKPGPVITNAKPGKSNHNHGAAFDAYPIDENGKVDVDWKDKDRLNSFAKLGKSLGFNWGGDFKSFFDGGHMELPGAKKASSEKIPELPVTVVTPTSADAEEKTSPATTIAPTVALPVIEAQQPTIGAIVPKEQKVEDTDAYKALTESTGALAAQSEAYRGSRVKDEEKFRPVTEADALVYNKGPGPIEPAPDYNAMSDKYNEQKVRSFNNGEDKTTVGSRLYDNLQLGLGENYYALRGILDPKKFTPTPNFNANDYVQEKYGTLADLSDVGRQRVLGSKSAEEAMFEIREDMTRNQLQQNISKGNWFEQMVGYVPNLAGDVPKLGATALTAMTLGAGTGALLGVRGLGLAGRTAITGAEGAGFGIASNEVDKQRGIQMTAGEQLLNIAGEAAGEIGFKYALTGLLGRKFGIAGDSTQATNQYIDTKIVPGVIDTTNARREAGLYQDQAMADLGIDKNTGPQTAEEVAAINEKVKEIEFKDLSNVLQAHLAPIDPGGKIDVKGTVQELRVLKKLQDDLKERAQKQKELKNGNEVIKVNNEIDEQNNSIRQDYEEKVRLRNNAVQAELDKRKPNNDIEVVTDEQVQNNASGQTDVSIEDVNRVKENTDNGTEFAQVTYDGEIINYENSIGSVDSFLGDDNARFTVQRRANPETGKSEWYIYHSNPQKEGLAQNALPRIQEQLETDYRTWKDRNKTEGVDTSEDVYDLNMDETDIGDDLLRELDDLAEGKTNVPSTPSAPKNRWNRTPVQAPSKSVDTKSFKSPKRGLLSRAFGKYAVRFTNELDALAQLISKTGDVVTKKGKDGVKRKTVKAPTKSYDEVIKALVDQGIDPVKAKEWGKLLNSRMDAQAKKGPGVLKELKKGVSAEKEGFDISTLVTDAERDAFFNTPTAPHFDPSTKKTSTAKEMPKAPEVQVKSEDSILAEVESMFPPVPEPRFKEKRTVVTEADIESIDKILDRYGVRPEFRDMAPETAVRLEMTARKLEAMEETDFQKSMRDVARKYGKFHVGALRNMYPLSMALLQSKSKPLRMATHFLLENPIAGRGRSASMTKSALERIFIRDVESYYTEGLGLYMQKINAGVLERSLPDSQARRDFNRNLFIYQNDRMVKGAENATALDGNTEIYKKIAEELERNYELMRQAQIYSEVTGFEGIPKSSLGYTPWIINPEKWRAMTASQKDAYRIKTADKLYEASQDRAKASDAPKDYVPLTLDEADLLARSYMRFQEKKASTNRFVAHDVFSDTGKHDLFEALGDMDVTGGKYGDLLKDLYTAGSKWTNSRMARDINAEIDSSGFRLIDVMEHDPMALISMQAKRVAGEVSLSMFGVQGQRGLSIIRDIAQRTGATVDELDSFDYIQAEMLNMPVNGKNPSQIPELMLSALRVTQLGNMVASQAMETFNILPFVGVLGAITHLPKSMKRGFDIWTRVKKGRVTAEDMRTFKEMSPQYDLMGGIPGQEMFRHTYFPGEDGRGVQINYGPQDEGLLLQGFKSLENIQQRLTLFHALIAGQKMAAHEIINRQAIRYITNKKSLSGMQIKALEGAGFNDELSARLLNSPNFFVRDKKGKIIGIDVMRMKEVDDLSAGTEFLYAVQRGVDKAVQEIHVGERGAWFHSQQYRLMFAMRSYVMNAMYKQLGNNLYNQGVLRTIGIMLGQATLNTPLFYASAYAKTIGMDEETREKYLESQLTPAALGYSAWSYVSSAGLLPDVLSIPFQALGYEVGNIRLGTGTSISTLNPVLGYMEAGLRVPPDRSEDEETGEVSYKFDVNNLRKVTPGGATIPIRGVYNIIKAHQDAEEENE